MKKLNKFLALMMVLAVLSSCEKNVIGLDGEEITDETSMFQISNMVPLPLTTANTVNQTEVNGRLLTNQTTPMAPFNYLPGPLASVNANKFFTSAERDINLKIYRGAASALTLSYDQNITLQPGKQTLFIHDFSQPPVNIPFPLPFPTVVSEDTGTAAWIRFINLMYESPGVPSNLKLQYQWQYTTDNETAAKSDWLNLGQPVAFGEATGWEQVYVNKTVEASSGTARIDYRIRLIGPDGSDQGSMQVRNTGGALVDYSDWWNAAIGRVYNHVFAGYRNVNASATPGVGIRQSVVH